VQGQVLGLARELRHLGVDVRVVAPCDGPPPAPGVVCVGPTVEWISNGSVAPIAADGSAARRTAEAIRSIEPHLVHLHEPAVPGPCLSTLIGFNGPMVGTFHASGELLHQWSRPAMRGLMSRLTTRVVVSEAARDTARLNWGGEYEVLWNGIEVDRFANATPTPSPVPAVFFVGRHEPRKGLASLLDAWSRLDRDGPLGCFNRAADEELRKRKVANAEWLGSISIPSSSSACAAQPCSAPSRHGESFGVVLLEAMAAGTPIVASAIEGTRTSPDPCEALLVEPGEVDDLGDALRRASTTPRLSAIVEAGRARAEFSMARLAERYVELYEKAVVAAPQHDCTRSVSEIEELAPRLPPPVTPSRRASVTRAPGNASVWHPAVMSRWRSTRSPKQWSPSASRRRATSRTTPRTAATWRTAIPARSSSSTRSTAPDRPRRGSSPAACRSPSLRRAGRCWRVSPETTPRPSTPPCRSAGQIRRRQRPTGAIPGHRSENTDLGALFWTAGLRGRPVVPVSIALEPLIDGRR
jgi:phosphatidylinositol alpha-mannosyltransferase